MDRVFLDANVLFSAAYRPDAGLRRLWGVSDAEFITSAYAVEEARRNLDSPQQRADLDNLLRSVRVISATPVDPPHMPVIDLPDKDRPILLAAIVTQATHLLTGDVRHFARYYGQAVGGVLILPPAVYLRTRLEQAWAPNRTSWALDADMLARKDALDTCGSVIACFESPEGWAVLHRLLGAGPRICTQVGPCGVDRVSLFLELSHLTRFVGRLPDTEVTVSIPFLSGLSF